MISKRLLDSRYRIEAVAERSLRYSQRHFRLFGLIAVVLIPLSTVVERAVVEPSFDTVYLRVLAAVAGLPVLFSESLPHFLKKNLHLVWIASATAILPFCFGAMLTFNAALTPTGAPLSPIWIYQYLVALFIFVQLVNDGRVSVLLWGIATVALFGVAASLENPNYHALQQAWLYPSPVYLTVLIIANFTNRNLHVIQLEQLRAASAIGSNLAHELRTPLASIRIFAHSMSRFLPILVDAHAKANQAGLSVEPVTQSQASELRTGLATIEQEVFYSNTIIDMLLVNTSDRPMNASNSEEIHISEIIDDAIRRYPFNNSGERELIEYWIESDFIVFAPRLLITHVLFNLIKNGLFFAQRGGAGRLTVTARSENGRNVVLVHDTGLGIPVSLQSRIFDRFFTTVQDAQSAGIGLSFCKMVMEGIGGKIECDSIEGEYTTFRLKFPSVG